MLWSASASPCSGHPNSIAWKTSQPWSDWSPTVAGSGVHVDVLDDLGLQRSSPADGLVQVVKLEPHQDPVAIPPAVGIDEVRVVFRVPGVKLEHQRAVHEEPIVEVVVVRPRQLAGAHGIEQSRVPAGARAHVADGEEGLRADGGGHAVEAIADPDTVEPKNERLV